MKILTLHCDYITFKPLKKAIKKPEELSKEREKEIKVNEPLVILTAVEKGDNEEILKQTIEAIKKTAGEVKAKNIVLYPYAHLSSNLSSPEIALEMLQKADELISKDKDLKVTRAPFGYYKEFELKVKGHPLSELSKSFSHEEKGLSAKDLSPLRVVSKDGKAVEEDVDISRLIRELSRTKLDTSKLKDNDHRILGQKLDLFSFHESSPGSTFWHPKGWTIYNELIKFSRELQAKAGYQEISTPQVFDNRLWKISGHWDHYKDNMFLTKYEDREFGIKPMNCPPCMLVYKTKSRSYKDLPLRLSEYGMVHRKELSGVLSGLFRVIKFTQDDAHIFCSMEHLESEISSILNIVKELYQDAFKFEYSLALSTRPEKFMGKKEDWDQAEKVLESVLKKSKTKFSIQKGGGAFYGPKIDISIKDSLGREWQCATIQLDMQMPSRFEISYIDKDNKEKTPIVIHRAIMGSLERFIGILLEHTSGNLPVWLSPVQVKVINFTDRNTKACEKFLTELRKEIPLARVEADFASVPIGEKVRNAELAKIPFIIVLGDKEEESKTIAVRERGNPKPRFKVKPDSFIKELRDKIEKRT